MTNRRPPLLDMLIESVRDPRAFAPRLVGWPVNSQIVWMAVLLMSVLSVLLVAGLPALMGIEATMPGTEMRLSPIALTGVQIGAMVLSAFAVFRVGAIFGGTGSFDGALRVVAWLQFVMVAFNLVQLLVLLLLAPLLGIVSLASIILIAWVGTGLIAGLHGFKSLPVVFAGIIGTMFAFAFALALIGTMLFGVRV
jgi:hypothetical protein